jgi:hypothetical protein
MPIADAARLAHAMDRSAAIATTTAARKRISDDRAGWRSQW